VLHPPCLQNFCFELKLFNEKNKKQFDTPMSLFANNSNAMKELQAVKQVSKNLNLYGKDAIVVGGTSGIGHGIALRLAQANANVYIVGRNQEKGLRIVDEMRAAASTNRDIVGRNPPNRPPKFGYIECDAMLVKNVKESCDLIQHTVPKIDYLICTQGISSLGTKEETSEGLPKKLAIHYYSRYAFAYYLTNHLLKAVDPRFVSVFSAGVHKPYTKFMEDADLKKYKSVDDMANATGLYNDFAVDALSQRNPQISYIHIAPGFVATNWGSDLPLFMKPVIKFLQRFAKSKEDCAEFMCQTVFNPEYGAPGFYLLDEFARPTKKTNYHHPDNVEFLWNRTEQVLKKYL
jgi:NAD(P)-dependent dehydrogenase (short-subunit alcohol dehydrogenase family)